MTVVFDQTTLETGTDDGAGDQTTNNRLFLPAGLLSAAPGATQYRITIMVGNSNTGLTLGTMYGGRASSSTAFNGNQTQITWSAAASTGNITGHNTQLVSDWINFAGGETWDNTKDFLISGWVPTGSLGSMTLATLSTAIWSVNFSGADNSSVTSPPTWNLNGSPFANQIQLITKIEVQGGGVSAQIDFPTRNIFKAPFRPPFGLRNLNPIAPPSTVASTLSAAGGTYTFSGSAITPAVGLPLAGGSYAFAGSAITPAVGMPLGGGSYVFTGTAVTLSKSGGQVLSPAGGTYSFSGTAATLGAGLPLGGGSYAFNGASATPGVGLTIPGGAYSFSGTAAAFAAHLSLLVPGGSYLFTGSGGTSLTYAPAGTGGAPPVHALTFLADIGSWSPP